MANPDQKRILQQGVAAWNMWYAAHREVIPDFSDDDLHGMDLRGAKLDRAEFCNSNLHAVNLAEADLYLACFIEADLSRSNLRHANLGRAFLRKTDLSAPDLRGTNLQVADLSEAILREANLRGADLRGANLTETDVGAAVLVDCRVYGISVGNLRRIPTEERDLAISHETEPELTVDGLELAQFLYLLLKNTKIRHAIDTITSKVVLILGRFTPERKAVLDALRNDVRRRGYVPVLFDFERPVSRGMSETVSLLAHMARFVIADITDAKSIPQELQRIVPAMPSLPIQPIILATQYEYALFEDFLNFPWLLTPYRYDSIDALLASLDTRVIGPAETKAQEVMERRRAVDQGVNIGRQSP